MSCFKNNIFANARLRLRLGGRQNFGDPEGHLDPARAVVNIRFHVAIQPEPDCSAGELDTGADADRALPGVGHENLGHAENRRRC